MDGSSSKSDSTPSIFSRLMGDYVFFSRKLAILQQNNPTDLDSIMEFVKLHPNVINVPDKQKNCFLHYAVLAGREDIVRELLKRGALADLVNEEGQTPLYHAIAKGDVGMTQLLLDVGKAKLPETGLHLAAEMGHLALVTLLIDRYGASAGIEALDQNRWRPLDLAANKGHLDVVQKLVKSGATVDEAAIHFAGLSGNSHAGNKDMIVEYLKNQKEHRESVSFQDKLEQGKDSKKLNLR